MTIDKIKLLDGTLVDLVNNQTIVLNADEINMIAYLTGSGSVELITGTTEDYRLILT